MRVVMRPCKLCDNHRPTQPSLVFLSVAPGFHYFPAMSSIAPTKVAALLGYGPAVGSAILEGFVTAGYTVAICSRTLSKLETAAGPFSRTRRNLADNPCAVHTSFSASLYCHCISASKLRSSPRVSDCSGVRCEGRASRPIYC